MGVGKVFLSGLANWALDRLTGGFSSKIGSWMHMHRAMWGHKPKVVHLREAPSQAKVYGSPRYMSSPAPNHLPLDPDGSYDRSDGSYDRSDGGKAVQPLYVRAR